MVTALPGGSPNLFIVFIDLVILVLYLLMPGLVFPTVPFGVRVPLAYARHPAVTDERRRYSLRLGLLAIAAVAVDGGLYWVTGWTPLRAIGTLALIFGCWGIYYLSHRRLAQVKADQRWFADTHQAVIASAVRRSPAPSRLAWAFLALPGALILATALVAIGRYPAMPASLHYAMPGVFGEWTLVKTPLNALLPVVFQAIMTLLCAGGIWLRATGPVSLDVEDPAGSQRYAMLSAQVIQALLALLALCFDIALLLAGLVGWGMLEISPSIITFVIAAPVLAWLVIAPALLLALRPDPCPVEVDGARYVNRDDDRFWVLGMFYLNRDDPSLLVNKRFGIGRTLNFGNPLAWVIALGLAAFITFRLLTR